jgi:hypothetical protein
MTVRGKHERTILWIRHESYNADDPRCRTRFLRTLKHRQKVLPSRFLRGKHFLRFVEFFTCIGQLHFRSLQCGICPSKIIRPSKFISPRAAEGTARNKNSHRNMST